MWNPFKKKRTTDKMDKIEEKTQDILGSDCFIIYYFDKDDELHVDFKFCGETTKQFADLMSELNTGKLYAKTMMQIVGVMEALGTPASQVKGVISMIESRISTILNSIDEDSEEPVVQPLHVFMPSEHDEEEDDE